MDSGVARPTCSITTWLLSHPGLGGQMTRVFCQQGTSLRTAALVPYRVIGHRRSLERPLQIGTGFGIFAARCQKIGIEEVAVETGRIDRSEEHTSELQSLMRISYAGLCLKKQNTTQNDKYYSN